MLVHICPRVTHKELLGQIRQSRETNVKFSGTKVNVIPFFLKDTLSPDLGLIRNLSGRFETSLRSRVSCDTKPIFFCKDP